MAKDHPKSIQLDCCWVCGTKFLRSGGQAIEESHHIIPRAYGGEDGPEVTLCETHHGILHRIASCLVRKKPYFMFVKGESKVAAEKLVWLGSQAANAEIQMKNDPNKSQSVLVFIDYTQKQQLEKLKAVYPNEGREKLMQRALHFLYHKHFMD